MEHEFESALSTKEKRGQPNEGRVGVESERKQDYTRRAIIAAFETEVHAAC